MGGLDEIVASANALQQAAMDRALTWTGERLFKKAGWDVPDDTDTGISIGEGLEGGIGYMEMDVRDKRAPNAPVVYEARGGYVEIGIGLGEISKAQGMVKKIAGWMPKRINMLKRSSDLVFMYGGSITQFILGPNHNEQLTKDDFEYGSYVYFHGGVEIAIAAGDIGIMFLLSPRSYAEAWGKVVHIEIGDALSKLLGTCLAWAPYYGTSVGLGAGGKIALRGIQTVSLTKKVETV